MYNESYEKSAALTSLIITTTSYYIFTINKNCYVIFIISAGATSLVTRLYRIYKKEYIMDHPLVYTDITIASLACISYIYNPFTLIIYYPLVIAFGLMVIAAIMSWNLFYVNLVQESFIFQLSGHIIISSSLVYYAINTSIDYHI
jgi:hypothetical protein